MKSIFRNFQCTALTLIAAVLLLSMNSYAQQRTIFFKDHLGLRMYDTATEESKVLLPRLMSLYNAQVDGDWWYSMNPYSHQHDRGVTLYNPVTMEIDRIEGETGIQNFAFDRERELFFYSTSIFTTGIDYMLVVIDLSTGEETIISDDTPYIYDLDVDPINGYVYWGGDHEVFRLSYDDLDNYDAHEVLSSGEEGERIRAVAVFADLDVLAWNKEGTLYSSDLEGSNITEITDRLPVHLARSETHLTWNAGERVGLYTWQPGGEPELRSSGSSNHKYGQGLYWNGQVYYESENKLFILNENGEDELFLDFDFGNAGSLWSDEDGMNFATMYTSHFRIGSFYAPGTEYGWRTDHINAFRGINAGSAAGPHGFAFVAARIIGSSSVQLVLMVDEDVNNAVSFVEEIQAADIDYDEVRDLLFANRGREFVSFDPNNEYSETVIAELGEGDGTVRKLQAAGDDLLVLTSTKLLRVGIDDGQITDLELDFGGLSTGAFYYDEPANLAYVALESLTGGEIRSYNLETGEARVILDDIEGVTGIVMAELGQAVSIEEEITHEILPTRINLAQNFPNPFNPATHITYDLTEPGAVTLEVFTVLGQRVATLVDQHQYAGKHTVSFEASHLSSGTYMYRLQVNGEAATRMMVLVK